MSSIQASNASEALDLFDFENALHAWFSQGHTRCVIRLQGPLAGSVLLAEPTPLKPRLTLRSIQTDAEQKILARTEQEISVGELAKDAPNASLIRATVMAKLRGESVAVAIAFDPRYPPPSFKVNDAVTLHRRAKLI